MFNYDIHNFSDDIEICNCAIPMWRLNMLFGPCVMKLCYHIWLLQCADLSLSLGVWLLYFAILPLHSSILQFRYWEKRLAFVICHFHSTTVLFFKRDTWTQEFFCLTDKGQMAVRSRSFKIQLQQAGQGRQKICFRSYVGDWLSQSRTVA